MWRLRGYQFVPEKQRGKCDTFLPRGNPGMGKGVENESYEIEVTSLRSSKMEETVRSDVQEAVRQHPLG